MSKICQNGTGDIKGPLSTSPLLTGQPWRTAYRRRRLRRRARAWRTPTGRPPAGRRTRSGRRWSTRSGGRDPGRFAQKRSFCHPSLSIQEKKFIPHLEIHHSPVLHPQLLEGVVILERLPFWLQAQLLPVHVGVPPLLAPYGLLHVRHRALRGYLGI